MLSKCVGNCGEGEGKALTAMQTINWATTCRWLAWGRKLVKKWMLAPVPKPTPRMSMEREMRTPLRDLLGAGVGDASWETGMTMTSCSGGAFCSESRFAMVDMYRLVKIK